MRSPYRFPYDIAGPFQNDPCAISEHSGLPLSDVLAVECCEGCEERTPGIETFDVLYKDSTRWTKERLCRECAQGAMDAADDGVGSVVAIEPHQDDIAIPA